jgi:ABC-type glycerol-3-phosphate transport system permease component
MNRLLRRHPFIYLILSIYALGNLLSFVWMTSTSLKPSSEVVSTSPWAPPQTVFWQNYADAWQIGRIGRYLLNSLLVTGGATLAALVLASMAAYILGRVRFRGSSVVTAVFMSAMMIPPFMIVVPLYQVLESLHLLNTRLGLAMVYVAMQVPLNTFILTAFHKTLPGDLEEAAAIDGASPVRTFARIILPLTTPAVVACGIVDVLHIWNEFLYALIFLQDRNLYTIPVGVFGLSQIADYSSNWGILFAGMVMSVLPVLVLFAVFQKQFTAGIAQGSLKG